MAIIRPYRDKHPRIADGAFIAENATLIGDIEIGPQASVWYGAVLRGDVGSIRVGARSNVQDNSCIHMTGGLSQTEIGDDVTLGHNVVIHGARIGNGVLVGMGSVVLDNASIAEDALVAAGSVVPPRLQVPAAMLVRGQPARVIRELTPDERRMGRDGARIYVELAREHRASSG